jgi:hypothetical protein
MRLRAIFKKAKMGTASARRNSRCADGFKALWNHQDFRGAISPDQEDKRGQDDRHGYEAIIETTTESVDPLGQISPFRAHGRISPLVRLGSLAGHAGAQHDGSGGEQGDRHDATQTVRGNVLSQPRAKPCGRGLSRCDRHHAAEPRRRRAS